MTTNQRIGVVGTERTLLLAVSGFRLVAVARGVVVLGSGVPAGHRITAVLAFGGAAAVTVLQLALAWRARRLPTPRASAFDAVAATAFLLVAGLASGIPGHRLWDEWPFPFVLTVILGIGLSGRSPRFTVLATLPIMAAHVAVCVHFGMVTVDRWALAVTAYGVNAVVSSLASRMLLDAARAVDAARAEAEADAMDRGRRTARTRWTGAVHDGVLQSLETMATGPWLDEPELRRVAGAEAVRLRAELRGDPPPDGAPAATD
jgi:hypothetical protein